MALKKNIFTLDFEKFRELMADFQHAHFFVSWQLKAAKASMERSLEVVEKQGHKNKFGGFCGLSMVNVFSKSPFIHRAPCGKRGTEGERIVPMVNEIEQRFISYLLVAVYERTESLFKMLYGRALFQLRGQLNIRDRQGFHRNHPNLRKHNGDARYCLAYAKYACRRDVEEAIDVFLKLLPWNTVHVDLLGMPFEDLVRVLAFCRHCIVHDEGRVPKEAYMKLNRRQRAFLDGIVQESVVTGEPTILPDKKIADRVIEAVLSYAYAIHVMLSEKCDMEIETKYFRRPGDPKPKPSTEPIKTMTITADGKLIFGTKPREPTK